MVGLEGPFAFGKEPMQNTTMPPVPASPVLDAERLHVYAVALDLNVAASALCGAVSRVLRDQLERAALSVSLNIAEGAGRHSRRQKRYHYGVARGSAAECVAVADVVRRVTPGLSGDVARVRGLALRCVQMLSRLETALRD